MAHGVHPAVKGVEPARLDPVLDRPRSDAGGEQLRTRDHPVLPAGERRDQLVDGKRDGFGPYSGPKASGLAHDPDRANQTATELTHSMPKFA